MTDIGVDDTQIGQLVRAVASCCGNLTSLAGIGWLTISVTISLYIVELGFETNTLAQSVLRRQSTNNWTDVNSYDHAFRSYAVFYALGVIAETIYFVAWFKFMRKTIRKETEKQAQNQIAPKSTSSTADEHEQSNVEENDENQESVDKLACKQNLRAMWEKVRKKMIFPCLQMIISFTLEMPLMVSNSCMLKAMGAINYDNSFWDMVLQVGFIINTFIGMWFKILNITKVFAFVWWLHMLVMIPGSVVSFLYTIMLYAPVSIAMVGWHWGETFDLSDFGGEMQENETVDVMLILMHVGHWGQYAYTVLVIIAIIVCICGVCCSRDDD